MTSFLTTQYPGSKPVDKWWTYEFIKHHDNLASKWNHKYNYQHAKYKNPILIWIWFKCIQNIKMQYRILDENTWNFDETGFQISVITTIRVVTGINRANLEQYSQAIKNGL
jgi:hypothetical protein